MSEKLTTIAYHTYPRALILKTQLEAAGIDCFLSGINMVQPTIGAGIRIKVREEDVQKALKIIESIKEQWGEAKEKSVRKLQSVRRILVPVDFSDYSLNACRYAIGLAEKLKAEIKLFHAYFKPILDVPAYEGSHMYQISYDKYFEEIEIKARNQLNDLRDQLKNEIRQQNIPEIKITWSLGQGFADDSIFEFCEQYKPGLVIIGSHGVAEKTEGIFGNIAQKLIDRLHIPILAIPSTAEYKGISRIKNVLYATDFDDSDVVALHKLIYLVKPFRLKLHCLHVSIGRTKPWDPVKMETLRNSFRDEYPGQKIECSIMVSDDILNGLETYMRSNNIGLVAFNTHKRTLFTQFFTPSITRQALKRLNKPIFIFRASE